jgi:1,4-dihydroxy-2-naphthoate octaprenyltransferase/chlorophyll synthase
MVEIAQRSVPTRWLYAVKLGSWPKLLVPFVLGQALGLSIAGRLSGAGLLVGFGFTLLGLLFIVLLNDWGDREIDRLKRSMFPDGCSEKTIADGILAARALLLAGLCAGACALAVAVFGAAWLGRPQLAWLGLLGMAVFVAYTLPPLRLNYRGGGELQEMLGVGAVLPLFNALCQSPQLPATALWPLPGFVLLSLASAVASGLSDEQSDREGGKTTVASRFGNGPARRLVELAALGGACTWLGAGLLAAPHRGWLVLLPVAFSLYQLARMRRLSASAVTNAFVHQTRYKGHLHRAIWHPAALLSLWLVFEGVTP